MKIAPDHAQGVARWLAAWSGRIWHCRAGNFGLLTALALVPMVGAVGLAYDYNSMLAIKSRMSDSLDAAAFEAAKLYTDKQADTVIADRAGRVFKADLEQFSTAAAYSFSYDGVRDEDGVRIVQVSGSTRYTPTFMPVLWGLLGQQGPDLKVSRTSEVGLATSTVELALVLDNSGSMAGSKISSLKTAAIGLVDDLFNSAAAGGVTDPVRISVVPFAGSVNVGPQNANAAWMDTKGLSSIHHENFDWTTLRGAQRQPDGSWQLGNEKLTRFWLYKRMNTNWGGCVEARPAPYDTNGAAPDPLNPDTLYVPMFAPDEPSDAERGHYYQNDYLADDVRGRHITEQQRQENITKYDRKPEDQSSTYGPNYACSTLSLMPLSTVKDDIRRKLNQMHAEGSTNIPQGVAWGLNTLTPGAPFDDARAFDAKRNIKAMVVMTDGENTYYRASNRNGSTYGAYGFAANGRIHAGTGNAGKYWDTAFTDSMNQHLLAVCRTARDEGIMLFTIAFDVEDGSSVKDMLHECASEDGKGSGKLYFDAKDSEDLKAAFGVIGSKIAGLRLYR